MIRAASRIPGASGRGVPARANEMKRRKFLKMVAAGSPPPLVGAGAVPGVRAAPGGAPQKDADIFWRNPRLFDLEGSEPFAESVAARAGDRMRLAQRRILEDAGGSLPAYQFNRTDMVKAPFI